MSVVSLPERVDALANSERTCFERLFAMSVKSDRPSPGAIVREDRPGASRATSILRISNRWAFEGTAFDPRRKRRTAPVSDTFLQLLRRCQTPGQSCPLCPEEIGGSLPASISDDHCLILDPRVKFDGYHALIAFTEHNPLVYTEEAITSYLEMGEAWAQACHRDSLRAGCDPAVFYLFTWNCLCGSLVHGHAQVVSHTRFPAPRLALLADAARRYRATGHNYFEDLWLAHWSLGLGSEVGAARVMASLTPIKERECLILTRVGDDWHNLARALLLALTTLQVDQPHGLWAFNLVVYSPPLVPVPGWEDWPILARLVDRGWPLLGVVDMGTMELYAESIVAHDPFVLATALRQRVEAIQP
jgi:hypothetical protein